jgi:uncharacterized protein
VRKIIALLCALFCLTAFAAEVIPSAPAHYFNDYAGVVSSPTAAQLDHQLEQFERNTSSQIVVAIFPKMQSDSSIEDYTVRVAQSWKVGQKGKNNGAVLFVFTQDRKMFLQVGYGLEGALPDALCKRIIEDEIKPQFKAGNFDAGLTAGVNAILAATKGEYKGNGGTMADGSLILSGNGQHQSSHSIQWLNRTHFEDVLKAILIFVVVLILIVIRLRRGFSSTYYSSSGWSGGSWSSGGSSWSGGGGGFSGGGGSFGGGGAGGSW